MVRGIIQKITLAQFFSETRCIFMLQHVARNHWSVVRWRYGSAI